MTASDKNAQAVAALKQIDEYGFIRRDAMLRLFEAVFGAAAELAAQDDDMSALDGAWDGLKILVSEMIDDHGKLKDQLGDVGKALGPQVGAQ